MVNYKRQIYTISSWLLIALIILLWIRFAISDNNSLENDISVKVATTSKFILNNDAIAKYHIFGSAQQLYATPLVSSNTSLNLTLNGTMSNKDATTGLAYISNSQGVQEKYKVGDKIFAMATLTEIYKTHVVINHNGKNERLAISEKTISSSTITRKKPNKKSASAYAKYLNGNQQRKWQETLNQQKFDNNKIASIVGNINLVTNKAGQIQGLRVASLAAGNQLAKHGLKANDIITAINGNSVSASNMLNIQETLKKNTNATITIKRNGKIQNIQVNLADL